MEWLIWAVLGGFVSKVVSVAVDAVFDRWHKRQHKLLNMAQARRRHAIQFSIAAVSCALYAWLTVMVLAAAIESNNVAGALIGSVLALCTWLFWRSARRRWPRYREARTLERDYSEEHIRTADGIEGYLRRPKRQRAADIDAPTKPQ